MYLHIYANNQAQTCIHGQSFSPTYIYIYIYLYVDIYMYMLIYIYIYICVWMCMYTWNPCLDLCACVFDFREVYIQK